MSKASYLHCKLTSDIDAVEIRRKDMYKVRIITADKVYKFTFKYALEAVMWYEGPLSARKAQREINRSSYKGLKYNADVFYNNFNQQSSKAISSSSMGSASL